MQVTAHMFSPIIGCFMIIHHQQANNKKTEEKKFINVNNDTP